MNALRQYKLSKEEKRAMQAEISRQARELTDKFALELDATLLWTIRKVSENHGKPWGAKMLREAYDTAVAAREELVKKYEMKDDELFILLYKLKEIGVDLEKWSKEMINHITLHIN